jgi:hypothetical protein
MPNRDGAAVARSPEDLRRVGNYVAALEHGIARLKTLPLSIRLVRELHEKLMTGVRGDHATPGELCRSQTGLARPAPRWRRRPACHRRTTRCSMTWVRAKSFSTTKPCRRWSRPR